MTRTAVAIRHVDFEDLGLLAPLLAEHNFEASYLEAATAGDREWSRADDADLLIVLGGPLGANDAHDYPFLAAELELIRERLGADRPTLGVCLGAQMMAVACGGAVGPGGTAEIGYAPLTLTDAGQASVLAALDGVPVLHWHGDVMTTPAGLPPLALTERCANQAFARGANALALQFHLEADTAGLEQWFVGHAYELFVRGIDVGALRADAARYGAQLEACATQVLGDWLSGLSFAAHWASPAGAEAR